MSANLKRRLAQDETREPRADECRCGVWLISRLAPANQSCIGADLDDQRITLVKQVEGIAHGFSEREAQIEPRISTIFMQVPEREA